MVQNEPFLSNADDHNKEDHNEDDDNNENNHKYNILNFNCFLLCFQSTFFSRGKFFVVMVLLSTYFERSSVRPYAIICFS